MIRLTEESVGKVYETRGVISVSMNMNDTKDLLKVIGINPVNGLFICVDVNNGLITEYHENGCVKLNDTRPHDLLKEYTKPRPLEEVIKDMVVKYKVLLEINDNRSPQTLGQGFYDVLKELKDSLAEYEAIGGAE